MITGLPVGITQQAAGGTGGGDADLLTSLYSVWELDAATFGAGLGTECEITGTDAAGGLHWTPNNGVGDVVGLLNGGANLGAGDATTVSTAYRWTLDGTATAHNTAEKRSTLFGCGTSETSFSITKWFYPTTDPNTQIGGLFSIGTSTKGWHSCFAGSNYGFGIDSKVYTVMKTASGDVAAASAGTWTLNAWNLLGVTWDHTTYTLRAFLNNDAGSSSTGSARIIAHTNSILAAVYQGQANPGGYRWDQTALWTNRVIDKATFDAVYNSGAGLLYSSWT